MKKFSILLLMAVGVSAGLLGHFGSFSAAAAGATPTPTPQPPTLGKPTPSPTPSFDDPNEIIKVDTELVNVTVRVVDRNGHPITGLHQDDFRVTEDGNPQQIDFFSEGEVPTEYGIVVDNSGSMRQQLDKVIEAGKVLVNTNRKDDKSLIIRFVSKENIDLVQPLTSNKADLTDALDNLYIEGGQTAIIDAVYLAVEQLEKEAPNVKSDDRKRRALVLVSDGEDRSSYYNEKQLFDRLRESEVQIFVVGFTDDLSKDGGFIAKSPRDKARAFLQRLADESGGKAYFPSSALELPALAKEISSELRTQYSIGYIPSNDRHDGTYRNIKVTVVDGPNQQKRIAIHRAGRTADSDNPSPASTPKKPN